MGQALKILHLLKNTVLTNDHFCDETRSNMCDPAAPLYHHPFIVGGGGRGGAGTKNLAFVIEYSTYK